MKSEIVSSDNPNGQIVVLDPNTTSARRYTDFHNLIAGRHQRVPFQQTPSVATSLLREKFFGQQKQFVALYSSQQWFGHVVARVSKTLRDDTGSPIGMLGFFDAIDDSPAITRLLHTASQWLNERGCKSIVGPIDGDTWYSYRLNSGPHDEPLFLSEPGNPDYYPRLWADAGFAVIDRYHSKIVDDINEILPLVKPSFDNAISQGYQFRHLDINRFDSELDIIYDLSTTVFSDNFLYDEISREQFKNLYRKAKSLVDPKLVWFALAPDGKEIGFLFCIIDYAQAVAAMKGKSNLWAKLMFVFNKRTADAVNFKSIGVIPQHRRSSVAAALMYQGYVESLAKGFRRANLCLIRDGNPSTKLDGGKSRILRHYELYGQFAEQRR